MMKIEFKTAPHSLNVTYILILGKYFQTDIVKYKFLTNSSLQLPVVRAKSNVNECIFIMIYFK